MELKNLSALPTDSNSPLTNDAAYNTAPKDVDVEANGHLEEDTKLLSNSKKAVVIVPAVNK